VKKKLIVGIAIVSIIFLVIIILIKQVPKTIELTTFEKAYNIVQQSTEECIEIPIYINYLDSYLVKKENIDNLSIKTNDEKLAFTVNKIKPTEAKTVLKKKVFYEYVFILNPSITLEDDFHIEMENAYLEINYVQGVKVLVKIGSFSYYFYNNDDSTLSVKQLKGLVNTYEDKTLVGITLGLKNNHANKITIKDIIPLDRNVDAALAEITFDKDYNQGDSIDQILGYKYDLYKENQINTFNLEIEDELNIFIPIKYKQDILLNKLGFLVMYEINEELRYLCIDDFTFFNTSLYSLKRINNLKFHVYENY